MATDANDLQPVRTGRLRRSQRVCLKIDIDVIVQRGSTDSPPERTVTLIVSAHGALISLRTEASIGDALMLRNVKTGEEATCRIVDRDAKEGDFANLGIEFVSPRENFWHVAFPPPDWTPRSPEAKSYRPQVVKNLPAAKT